jgi:peptide/nickel transport system permease protein
MTVASPALATSPPAARRRGAIVDFCRQQPLGAVSFLIIFAMMFAGIFAEWVSPYDPLAIDFAAILMPPSWEHWCGTDAYGRDIFSRIIYGSRTALVIGFTSSFVGSTLGAVLGVASAYFGGKVDDWIQRVIEVLLAFPIIVLALVVVAAVRSAVLFDIDVNLIIAIAIPILPRSSGWCAQPRCPCAPCPTSMPHVPPATPTAASSSATWLPTWWPPT